MNGLNTADSSACNGLPSPILSAAFANTEGNDLLLHQLVLPLVGSTFDD